MAHMKYGPGSPLVVWTPIHSARWHVNLTPLPSYARFRRAVYLKWLHLLRTIRSVTFLCYLQCPFPSSRFLPLLVTVALCVHMHSCWKQYCAKRVAKLSYTSCSCAQNVFDLLGMMVSRSLLHLSCASCVSVSPSLLITTSFWCHQAVDPVLRCCFLPGSINHLDFRCKWWPRSLTFVGQSSDVASCLVAKILSR